MKRIYRNFLLWLMDTKVYNYALKHIIPYIRFTTYYTSFRGWKYHKGYKLLKPGDGILTIDKKKLTTILIPGDFSHACFCRSKDGVYEITEMTHNDTTKSTFFDVCREASRVVIYDRESWTDKYRQEMINKDEELGFVPYDRKFELGIAALSCAERNYEIDFKKTLGASLEDIIGLGKLYISPDGLYKAKNIRIKWDSDWENKHEGENS